MQGISVQTHSEVCTSQIIKPLQSSDRDTIYFENNNFGNFYLF